MHIFIQIRDKFRTTNLWLQYNCMLLDWFQSRKCFLSRHTICYRCTSILSWGLSPPSILPYAWFNNFILFRPSYFLPVCVPFCLLILSRRLSFSLHCSHFFLLPVPDSSYNWTCIQGCPLILQLPRPNPSWGPQETTPTNYLLSERYRGPPCNVADVSSLVWWSRYLIQSASPLAESRSIVSSSINYFVIYERTSQKNGKSKARFVLLLIMQQHMKKCVTSVCMDTFFSLSCSQSPRCMVRVA
jgi:hypothetical protein